MSINCVKEIDVCSPDSSILDYWEGLKVYSKYIAPYATYAKWTEYLIRNPDFAPPEAPIKFNLGEKLEYSYLKVISYIVYKIINLNEPFTLYFDGTQLSTSPLNMGLEIYITPTRINFANLPVEMQALVDILRTQIIPKAEMEGIQIRKKTYDMNGFNNVMIS